VVCWQQLADKRKGLLDELAIKYQQESNEHREHVKTVTQEHKSQVEQLSKQIEELTVSTSLSLPCLSTLRLCL